VEVTAANVHDTNAGLYVFDALYDKYRQTLRGFCADSAYQGNAKWYAEGALQIPVDIVKKIGDGFQVQPQRWIVERTLAWLGHDRRLSKDYEVKVKHSENFIRLSMIKRTAARLR
jgi:putative transposase